MYTTTMSQPDPGVFMRQFLSSEVATKANKYQGRNITRWQNADYDKLHDQSDNELDPVKRAAHVHRDERPGDQGRGGDPGRDPPRRVGGGSKLHAPLSGWDSNFYALQDWYRDA